MNKILKVLERLQKEGPEVAERLKSYLSVQQTVKKENPEHLPDVYKETNRVLEEQKDSMIPKMTTGRRRLASPSRKTKQEIESENYFKPYDNAQSIAFPEQARIEDKRLEVFRYDMVSGLVEALSERLEQEEDRNNQLEELTLDQNNLSDQQLARILGALYEQGWQFHQSCLTINISNNEFGRLSAAALIRFFEFQSPDNLQNLRLSNLRLNDSLITDIFTGLQQNASLQKLRLSGISLT